MGQQQRHEQITGRGVLAGRACRAIFTTWAKYHGFLQVQTFVRAQHLAVSQVLFPGARLGVARNLWSLASRCFSSARGRTRCRHASLFRFPEHVRSEYISVDLMRVLPLASSRGSCCWSAVACARRSLAVPCVPAMIWHESHSLKKKKANIKETSPLPTCEFNPDIIH